MVAPVEDALSGVVETEFDLVGATLNDPIRQWPKVVHIRGGDFYEPILGELWEAVRETIDAGAEPSIWSLLARFMDDPRIEQMGGRARLLDLFDKSPPATAAPAMAEAVLTRSLRHRAQAALRLPGEHMARELREVADRAATAPGGGLLRVTPYAWTDPASIAPRQWLYGRHLIRKFVSCTVAPGGMGKSSMVLVEAVAMASGKPLLGEQAHGPLRVWAWNGEDPLEEIDRRLGAIRMAHKVTEEDCGGRLFVDSGQDLPLQLATGTPDGFELNEGALRRVERQIVDNALDVVIFDPFISLHGIPENNNNGIDAVVKALGRIANRTGCAFEIVHHIRKPGAGQVGETTVDDARGASALIGAVRSARVLNGMTAAEAEKAGIDNRLQFFNVGNGKANLAPRSGLARWRRIVSVDLGNATADRPSDEIGVVTAWEMPGAFDGITGEHVRQVQAAVHRGVWRINDQSSKEPWVGHAVAGVLGLDEENAADKARVKELVRVWVENKVLLIDERRDDDSKLRKYVVVGEWVTPDEDF